MLLVFVFGLMAIIGLFWGLCRFLSFRCDQNELASCPDPKGWGIHNETRKGSMGKEVLDETRRDSEVHAGIQSLMFRLAVIPA